MIRTQTILLLALLYSLGVCAQTVIIENDSLILWKSSRKLNWDDFKGPKEHPKDVHLIHQVAGTASKVIFLSSVDKEGNPIITPFCYFEKYRSWSITDSCNILKHEQIHFDIQEVFVRKIRERINHFILNKVVDEVIYNNEVDTLLKKCREYQGLYDKEVLLNYKKQLEWQTKISRELEDLKEYEYIPEE